MKKQFDSVDCRYGSPMGRAEWCEAPTVAKGNIGASGIILRQKLDELGYA